MILRTVDSDRSAKSFFEVKMVLKKKLSENKVVLGSWITLAHPAIAEIIAKAGFDWVAVDLEHSTITIREAEELIRVIDLCGVTPLVRLTANDPNQIKRVLDAGAKGIIVPFVNTVQDAQAAVSAVYYPPRGKRGVGLARAQGYGTNFEPYLSWMKDGGPVIIAMIEHIEAVKNMEAILSVDGIDGYFIGPYDLSSSMGLAGQFENRDVKAAIATVKSVGEKMKKPGGIHVVEPDPEQLLARRQEGFTFLAYSLDTRILTVSCHSALLKMKEESK